MFTGIVIGNLGADAEVVTSNGNQFITLSIAETRKFKKEDGTSVSVTSWVDAIISNHEHPVLPFLKQGTRVCVIGEQDLRVYSSKKDRCMKAGATIHVRQIELIGGQTDDVPRQLVNPDDGTIIDVQKFYWVNLPTKGMKKEELRTLYDTRSREFLMDSRGFVVPAPKRESEGSEQVSGEEKKE